MNITDMFISFTFALIVKDFYDIFIASHIRELLSNYKLLIIKNKKEEKKHESKTKKYNR